MIERNIAYILEQIESRLSIRSKWALSDHTGLNSILKKGQVFNIHKLSATSLGFSCGAPTTQCYQLLQDNWMHVCKEFSDRKRKELEQELEWCCVQRHFGLCSTCFVYVTAVYRSCTVLLLQHGMRLAMQENVGHWFSAIIRQAKWILSQAQAVKHKRLHLVFYK